jgi:hypothetical protein
MFAGFEGVKITKITVRLPDILRMKFAQQGGINK